MWQLTYWRCIVRFRFRFRFISIVARRLLSLKAARRYAIADTKWFLGLWTQASWFWWFHSHLLCGATLFGSCQRPLPPSVWHNLVLLPERDYVMFGSFCRKSVCLSVCLTSVSLSVTLVHSTQEVEAFGHISSRCVRWPSSYLRAKFYGDRPRGTPPPRALNARGVSK